MRSATSAPISGSWTCAKMNRSLHNLRTTHQHGRRRPGPCTVRYMTVSGSRVPPHPPEPEPEREKHAPRVVHVRESAGKEPRTSLDSYRTKRNFARTPGPAATPVGGNQPTKKGRFVVQKHRARQLHYDFRLEIAGVLKSWAVPKGPSLDPSVKRFATQVEDHPIEYADFEGVIPEGYGAGTVMVWDRGTFAWDASSDREAAFDKGQLKFRLHGKKLRGSWVLIRTRGKDWLLIKHRDEYAKSDLDITQSAPKSVISGRTLRQIAAAEGGDVERAASGDPPQKPAHRGTRLLDA